jgi:peroxiredoxin
MRGDVMPMLRRFTWMLMLAVLCRAGVVAAGEYNDVMNIGDQAPAWEKLPGTDGKEHSLSDLKDKDVVIVVFTCNSCPIATDYEERLLALAKKYCGPSDRAAMVAINVNRVEADLLPAMKVRAQEKGYTFPYLFDETQKIAKDFGAVFTPEVFVLNKARKVVYMGGIDDNSRAADVKEHYLEPAIQAALKGEAAKPAETVARGCRIRYARERK